MSEWERLQGYLRLSVLVASVVGGVAFACHGLSLPSLAFFLVAAVIVYATVTTPDSITALQEDARERARLQMLERFI